MSYVGPSISKMISELTDEKLQRHGARWPTSNAGAECKSAVKKLKQVKKYKEDYLDFLKHFKYDLGVDDLLPFGAKQ